MNITVSDIRTRVQEIFQTKGGKCKLVLLYLIATLLMSLVSGLLSGIVMGILSFSWSGVWIGLCLVFCLMLGASGVLCYGEVKALQAVRQGESFSIGTYFRFENLGHVFGVTILQGIFTFLWSLLLVVPGIMKAYSYSFAYYVLDDEPDTSALESITKSRELTHGHKWTLFKYDMFYTLWYVILTLVFNVICTPGIITDSPTLLGVLLLISFGVEVVYWFKCLPMILMGRYELYTQVKNQHTMN